MSYSSLETKYKGFMEGGLVDEFLTEFNVKFAAGTWTAGDFSDRFNRTGYFPNLKSDLVSQLSRIRDAGIRAFVPVDAQFLNSSLNVDEGLVKAVKDAATSLNLRIAGLALDLSGIPMFKMGTLTNPDPAIRKRALETFKQSLGLAKDLGTDSVSLWLGSDGWDYSLEVNYGGLLNRLIDGLVELGKVAAEEGLRIFGVEAKPKEPREGNLSIPTSHASILLVSRLNAILGRQVFGITMDYGHELMYAVEPAYTVYLAKLSNVPIAVIHLNSSKWHSNDEDRVVGAGDAWQFIDFIYALLDTGYDGWYVLDQFTYRLNPVDGLRISKELFANLYKKALALYTKRSEFEGLRNVGDQAKTLDFVKRIIYGY